MMDEKVATQFGVRLRAARQERGVSQRELGDRAGLPRSTIYRLEVGHREPKLSTVLLLADSLRMPAGDLIDGIQRAEAPRLPRDA